VTTDADDRSLGAVLGGRYQLEARLGHGAMGTVYRARHVQVGRAFAVKVLHARLLGDDRVRRRFAREAALAGSLHHTNVASVVDVGEMPDGRRYLVMEYAEGETLLDMIQRDAPLPAARFLSIVRQLCNGLQHAHDLGLIHRDLKPENVILERETDGGDHPRIVDFGVAIVREDAASSDADRLTSVGLVIGTPMYMAPEHATGKPIDHRIDLFALGVMCFEMLTGTPPYDGDGVDLARANLTIETPAMSARAPQVRVDPLLEAFTRRLMMKSRDDRPASARAARELLDLIERDRQAAASALGVPLADAAPPQRRLLRPASSPGSWTPSAPGSWAASVAWHAPAMVAGLAPMSPADAAPAAFIGAAPRPVAVEVTERIAPVRSHRTSYVIVAAAALAVLATMVLALNQRRVSRSAAPRPVPAHTSDAR
jgi:serine/threonine-protein kinase